LNEASSVRHLAAKELTVPSESLSKARGRFFCASSHERMKPPRHALRDVKPDCFSAESDKADGRSKLQELADLSHSHLLFQRHCQHALLQDLPGSKEMGFNRAHRQGELPCYLPICHLLEIAQDEDQAVVSWQLF
jgi:hypothetical protein